MILSSSNFLKDLNKQKIFEKKPNVAVGVSGGPDSMALISLLNCWKNNVDGKITALIVNHNIREESKEEAIKVLNYLKSLNIPAIILRVNKSNIKKKNMNEARINRYKLLTRYCQNNKILHLFLAHHKDDNIETFVNRRVAGSNYEGLDSIKKYTVKDKINIIRPLIQFKKIQIIKYCKSNNIKYLIDPTNKNLNYTRPVIRLFLKNASLGTMNEINKDYFNISNNMQYYRKFIFELLIKNVIFLNRNVVIVNYRNFMKIDDIIAQNLIKKLYQFLYGHNTILRSNKLEKLFNELKNVKFKEFNIKSMIVSKTHNSIEFRKKII